MNDDDGKKGERMEFRQFPIKKLVFSWFVPFHILDFIGFYLFSLAVNKIWIHSDNKHTIHQFNGISTAVSSVSVDDFFFEFKKPIVCFTNKNWMSEREQDASQNRFIVVAATLLSWYKCSFIF